MEFLAEAPTPASVLVVLANIYAQRCRLLTSGPAGTTMAKVKNVAENVHISFNSVTTARSSKYNS